MNQKTEIHVPTPAVIPATPVVVIPAVVELPVVVVEVEPAPKP